jgi:hypothetical protein
MLTSSLFPNRKLSYREVGYFSRTSVVPSVVPGFILLNMTTYLLVIALGSEGVFINQTLKFIHAVSSCPIHSPTC